MTASGTLMTSSETTGTGDPSDDVVEILYDRECPVCDAYCNLADVQAAAGKVRRLDARQDSELLREVTARSLDVDEGMVVRYRGTLYYGADAIHMLALLSPGRTLFDRFTNLLFRSKRRARVLYPVLKSGRNLLLKMLGRTRINNLGGSRDRF
jgi:predicted DCC family thiol-disulfide oxidoreductase YuxK